MPVASPLDRLEAKYGELLALCDAVQLIIDSLSGRMDRDLCIATAAKIRSLDVGWAPRTDRLSGRTNYASPAGSTDVAAALGGAASGRSALPWEAIASMLSTFVCDLRRHIAAEQAIIDAIKRSKAAH
ncbi:hypothetical protein C7U60_15705 [Mesorhizobium plurifarium]|uniref:hypothetical protein n=1 Tax=Sinorhizobium arboris TaxID=76745 RepID=UPI00040B5A83|nr:hypothetical protein [Sinorhizobium arboris]PST20634.1 hypothetical protein C7U60_15705 [Mesorhizobium plurifarium]